MLRFFKNNNPFMFLLIPVLITVLQINNFTEQTIHTFPKETSFLYSYIFGLINGKNLFVFTEILSILLLTVISILLIYIENNLKIFKQNNFLHAFVFIFIVSAFFPLYKSLPLIIGLVFLLFAFSLMLKTIRKQVAVFDFFNIGFLVAVSSMFYFNLIWFIFLIFAGLLFLRPVVWREWVSSFVGIVTPYIIVFMLYFLLYGDLQIVNKVFSNLFHKEIKQSIDFPLLTFYSYTIIIAFFATISVFTYYYKLNIRTKAYLKLYLTIFFISTLIYLFSSSSTNELIILFSISISVPLVFVFNNAKRKKIAEIIFDLMILLMIFVQIKFSILDLF